MIARVVAAVIALNLGLAALDRALPTAPTGPAFTASASGGQGFRTWASTLSVDGHQVGQRRDPLGASPLDASTTVVVAETDLRPAAADALAAFVAAGGRLVVVGGRAADALETAIPGGPSIGLGAATSATPVVTVPEVAGVTAVRSTGSGQWADPQATLPILGCPGGLLASVANHGQGRIVYVADASLVTNDGLHDPGNLAFARAAVGPVSRPVVFADFEHGVAGPEGPGSLPVRVVVALVAALAALTVAGARWTERRSHPAPVPPDRPDRPDRHTLAEVLADGVAADHTAEVTTR